MITPCAEIIDEERKVKHARFGSRIEEAMTDPDKVKVKLRAENVDISYPPIVQVALNRSPQTLLVDLCSYLSSRPRTWTSGICPLCRQQTL